MISFSSEDEEEKNPASDLDDSKEDNHGEETGEEETENDDSMDSRCGRGWGSTTPPLTEDEDEQFDFAGSWDRSSGESSSCDTHGDDDDDWVDDLMF